MRFSIVTPSFGQLDWLELCVASVADQRGIERVEHIICDAGSEGIVDFRKRMLERFPETRNYRLAFDVGPDAGMYDAVNKGLRQATGEILSYLNSDEQLLPEALRKVRGYFELHRDIDVVFGDAIVVGKDGDPLCYWRTYVPTLKHLAGATLNTLSCSMFFQSPLVEQGHLFEPQWKAVGDLRWIQKLLRKGCAMSCLRESLAIFTFLGDNLGASRKAHEEFEASREDSARLAKFVRRGIHALRKLLSGAYVRRQVTYDIYALSDPLHRRRFHSDRLGWTWPGLDKSQ